MYAIALKGEYFKSGVAFYKMETHFGFFLVFKDLVPFLTVLKFLLAYEDLPVAY